MKLTILILNFIISTISHPLNSTEEFSSSSKVESSLNSQICRSEKGKIRECVPYYLCIDGKVNKNGANVINVRFGGGEKCVEYFEECCEVEKFEEARNEENFCGVRKVGKKSYKITENNDGEAEFGEFPWVVAILRGEKKIN